MELKDLQTWLQITNTLVIWIAAIYTYLANRNRVTTERINSLQASLQTRIEGLRSDMDHRMDNHGDRLSRVEKDIQHAPSHDDLKRIHARMDEVSATLSSLQGEFKGANNTLHLIHTYLMTGGKQ
jgi:exonuclease VII large subunit